MPKRYTGIIKKDGDFYVALCLELNVASQGESIAEAKQMLKKACEEYLPICAMKAWKMTFDLYPWSFCGNFS